MTHLYEQLERLKHQMFVITDLVKKKSSGVDDKVIPVASCILLLWRECAESLSRRSDSAEYCGATVNGFSSVCNFRKRTNENICCKVHLLPRHMIL